MPPTKKVDIDRVFHALADPTRRAILDRLGEGPVSVSRLAEPFQITLTAVGQHLQVLEEAKLIGIAKSIQNNRPQTFCRITALGRKRYVEYLAVLDQEVLTHAGTRRRPVDATRIVEQLLHVGDVLPAILRLLAQALRDHAPQRARRDAPIDRCR